jgi:hypothetical protein
VVNFALPDEDCKIFCNHSRRDLVRIGGNDGDTAAMPPIRDSGFILAYQHDEHIESGVITMITKPMVYPIRFWAVVLAGLLALQVGSEALADYCKYEKDIDLELDLSGSDKLAIAAGAGSLEITGKPGVSKAVISGRACVSKEEWLEKSTVKTSGGARAEITVELPQDNGSWFSWGNNYAYIDLEVAVPASMELEVSDSSGHMLLQNVGAVDIKDSSGGIELTGAGGAVTINDSSGDIEIEDVDGDVTLNDSSGGIYGSGIEGSVLVERDSSGNIRFEDVSGNVIVKRDSSGNIKVSDVGGDFRVLKDGSGSITSNNVKGEVETP